MPKKKIKSQVEETVILPQIVRGSHLTITYHADGRVDMEWDWDQLNREINEAIETWYSKSTTEIGVSDPIGVSNTSKKVKNKVTSLSKSDKKSVKRTKIV